MAKSTGIRKWFPLIVLSSALTIIILDTTILNVSLKNIVQDLHTDIQSIQWVITIYSLMLAAFTITGGRMGDFFGRKRMFILGAVIFAIGSFITSISYNIPTMIIGEAIIEGIGACLMLPATTSLLVSTYEGRDRQIGFGIWGGIAAGSAALGPIFGGWLTTYYSWRWAFRVNVFVAVVLILGSFLIKEVRDTEEKPDIDYVGIILSSLGLLSIVFGLIEASTYGWWLAKQSLVLFGQTIFPVGATIVPYFIAAGIFLLELFILWEIRMEKKGRTPLVSLSLFKNRQFSLAALVTAVLALVQSGVFFAMPVFLQAVKHLDALHTGYVLLPMTLSLLVAAPFSAYISKYIKPKHLIQAGLLIDLISFFVLRSEISITSSTWALTPGFILFGIGSGFLFSQTSNMALSAVSVQESGEASGVNTTLRQLGATLGSAILGAILLSVLSSSLINGVNASAVIPEQLKPTIVQNINQQSSGIEFGGPSAISSGNIPPVVSSELTSLGNQATVDGNRASLLYGAFIILAGLLISFGLPNSQNVERNDSVAAVRSVNDAPGSGAPPLAHGPMNVMEVAGKVAIVTGASSGIGLAAAILLARHGAKVVLVSRRQEELEKIASDLEDSFPIAADLSIESQARNMIQKTLGRYGRIDILVNNAGRGYMSQIVDVNTSTMRQLYELNVFAPVALMQEVIPHMKQQGGGSIVNISSGTALMALPGVGAYSSSKRALAGLSLTAREELKADNINVSVIYPYITATDFYKNLMGGSRPSPNRPGMADVDPPEHIANLILQAIQTGQAEIYAHDWMRPV
jgi:EmrB/QacA subfamily drug resistance transporter